MSAGGSGRGSLRPRAPLLAALPVAVWAAIALADADPVAALRACRALADSVARLDCFDRESAAFAPPAAPTPAAAPAATAPSTPAAPVPALAAEQVFGLPPGVVAAQASATVARPNGVNDIEARVVTLAQTADGRLAFTLDSGQVWLQVAPGEELLLAPGETVKLSRGAIGSYWLRAPSGRSCKVRRIR